MLEAIFNRGIAGTAQVPTGNDAEGQPVYANPPFAVKVLIIESADVVRNEFGDVDSDTLLLIKSSTELTRNTKVVVGGKTYVAAQRQVYRSTKDPNTVEGYGLGVRGGGL